MISPVNTYKSASQPTFKALQRINTYYWDAASQSQKYLDKLLIAEALQKQVLQETKAQVPFAVVCIQNKNSASGDNPAIEDIYFLSGKEFSIYNFNAVQGSDFAVNYLRAARQSVNVCPDFTTPVCDQIQLMHQPELRLANKLDYEE